MLRVSRGNSCRGNGHRSVLCYHSSTAGRGGAYVEGSDGLVTSRDEGEWRRVEKEVKGSLNLSCVLHSRTGKGRKMTPAGPGNPGSPGDSRRCV